MTKFTNTRYVSGNRIDLKVGLRDYSESDTSLEVIGKVGIGTSNAESLLDVKGDANFSGVVTATKFVGEISGDIFSSGISTFQDILVSGASTFTGNIDADGDLDVDGLTNLDDVNVSGASTFGGKVDINASADLTEVNVSGASTFGGIVDINALADVNELNVSIAATAASIQLVAGVAVTTILDEDNFSSDREDALATQQSIKAYVDSQVTAQDLDFSGDSGTGSVDLDGETFNIIGTANEVVTSGSGTTLTIGLTDDITVGGALTVTGAADFNIDINVSGASTFSGNIDVDGLTDLDDVNVSGASTFTGNIDANGDLDVDGLTDLDDVNVSGASTFAGVADFNGNDSDGLSLTIGTGVTVYGNAGIISASQFWGSGENLNDVIASKIEGISIKDEGTPLSDNYTVLDFVGGFTTATGIGSTATITIGQPPFAVQSGFSTQSGLSTNVEGGANRIIFNSSENTTTTSANLEFDGSNLNVSGIITGQRIDVATSNVSIASTTQSLTVGTGVAVTTILDEDDLISDSEDALATQQSIKAYVDSQVTAQDLDFSGDTGTGAVDLDSETFDIVGTANEIVTSGSGTTLTIGLPDDVTVGGALTVTGVVDINGNGSEGISLTVGTGVTVYGNTGIVSASQFWGSGENLNDVIASKIEGIEVDDEGVSQGDFSVLNFIGEIVAVSGVGSTANITVSTPGFAQTAGFTTNVLGGASGNILYQTATDTTGFVDSSGATNGQVVLWNGTAPFWGNVEAAAGAFGGISVQDDGDIVGTANSIRTLNFDGPNLEATATSGANGIATITISDNLVGSALSISGISTFNDEITANSFRITTGDKLYVGNNVGTAVTITTALTRLVAVGYNVLKNINSASGGGANVINSPVAFGENSLTDYSVDFGTGGSCLINSQISIGIGCLSTFNLTGGGGSRTVGPNIVMGYESGRTISGTVNNLTHQNVIVGYQNVYSNNFISANNNAIFGIQCGYALSTGASGNALFGYQSGYNITSGDYNTLLGYQAGYSVSTGQYNIGIGYSAGQVNMTGSRNIVIGYNRDVPSAAGNDQLVIGSNTDDWIIGDSSYNVGLGTTSPTSKLHVVGDVLVTGVVTATTFSGDATNVIGGIASVTSLSVSGISTLGITSVTSLSVSGISTLGTVEISSGIVSATSGVVTYFGDGSNLTGVAAEGGVSISTQTSDQAQYIPYATSFGSTTGLGATSLYVFNPSNSRLGIGTTNPQYNLQVIGDFAATSKSFVIDHPTKPDKKLRYASLEGPENGVYVRGRSQEAVIELPDYWTELVDNNTITVNLTPIGRSATPRVDCQEINNNIINVFSVEEGELDYYYTVYGERKDIDKLIVEY